MVTERIRCVGSGTTGIAGTETTGIGGMIGTTHAIGRRGSARSGKSGASAIATVRSGSARRDTNGAIETEIAGIAFAIGGSAGSVTDSPVLGVRCQVLDAVRTPNT
jgi:hypothetical protein